MVMTIENMAHLEEVANSLNKRHTTMELRQQAEKKERVMTNARVDQFHEVYIRALPDTLPDHACKQMFKFYKNNGGARTNEQLAFCEGYMKAVELMLSGEHLPSNIANKGGNDDE